MLSLTKRRLLSGLLKVPLLLDLRKKKTERQMKATDYGRLYKKAFDILGDLTPLKADCGTLCERRCCKGDSATGMLLFPHEESTLNVIYTHRGERLAVCNGSCNRAERPLSCRIFPFFPTVDEKGRVFAEKDLRAAYTCPLLIHSDEIVFDKRFFRAVKKVGKLLAKDAECLAFMQRVTEEIDFAGEFK